jgi:hypothetical protein
MYVKHASSKFYILFGVFDAKAFAGISAHIYFFYFEAKAETGLKKPFPQISVIRRTTV